MLQASFQELVREPPCGVPGKEVPPAIPHWPLNEAIVVALAPVDYKGMQSCSQVPMAWVGRVCLVDGLVRLEFISACVPMVTGEYFESDITSLPTNVLINGPRMRVKVKESRRTEGRGRARPLR